MTTTRTEMDMWLARMRKIADVDPKALLPQVRGAVMDANAEALAELREVIPRAMSEHGDEQEASKS